MSDPLAGRAEAVYLFDVTDGNPNGDPDAGNMPRMDPETGHGIVTDVSLKRKIRNFVGLLHNESPPYEIYIKDKSVLNRVHERAYQESGAESKKRGKNTVPSSADEEQKVLNWLCANFYDIRTFGAVMTTQINAGQVRGPVQISFARSVVPIVSVSHSITRMAVTNEADIDKERTMGEKHTIPYGLYRAHVFVSPAFASRTNFGNDDLELLWNALAQMFEHDHSAARGQMTCRGLYVFQHDNPLGREPSHRLFDRVEVSARPDVRVPRQFGDFAVTVNDSDLPEGVSLRRIVDESAEETRALAQ